MSEDRTIKFIERYLDKLRKKNQKDEASFILNKEVMLKKISKRAISTGQLNDFHHLHIRPIKQIVFLSS